MALTASDIQAAVSHWLHTPPNSYLGSGYGAPLADLLMQPLASGIGDTLIAKLREDIPIIRTMDPSAIAMYSRDVGPDRVELFIEVAGVMVEVPTQQAGNSEA
jgi:hypothetical protein